METIHASVSKKLLAKVSRMFTGTIEGRIIEVLQNARRAGAKTVTISHAEIDGQRRVVVVDDGEGVGDFASLLAMGDSNWSPGTQQSEDPAGVGLFALAPRPLAIISRGRRAHIEGDGWTGAPVEVKPHRRSAGTIGTRLEFVDDQPWLFALVAPLAKYLGLKVTVDGAACPSEDFMAGSQKTHLERLGCHVGVFLPNNTEWWDNAHNTMINFHGQLIPLETRNGCGYLRYRVELTGEPTGLRMILPARTAMFENAALAELHSALEIEGYRFWRRNGSHALAYRNYMRARDLGVDLPEAPPKFTVGLPHQDGLEGVFFEKPGDFPLSACHRIDHLDDIEQYNATLLAAAMADAEDAKKFAPVSIQSYYDGYAWADLPRVESCKVKHGAELHKDYVNNNILMCAESLSIEVRCSDGRTFSSPARLAILDYDSPCVTRDAAETIGYSELWHALGGASDAFDSGSYDHQEFQVYEELDKFWADISGPLNWFATQMIKAMNMYPQRDKKPFKKITVRPDRTVTITLESGEDITIKD